MRVTDRDRRHFQAIADAKRLERDERRREAAAQDPGAKVVEGLVLGHAFPRTPAMEEMADRRALAQAELHARWRRLRAGR